MARARRPKGVWVAALLPLLAAAVLPTRIQTLVCRFTGVAMPAELCCPRASEAGPGAAAVQPQASLREESCCLIKTVDLPRLLSEGQPDEAAARPVMAAPIAGLVLFGPPRGTVARRWPIGVGPPRCGPRIVLLKRSFLI